MLNFCLSIADFNSIKVQLKLSLEEFARYGKAFQFHKGTIKTKLRMTRKTRKRHFNSIKVQLKLCHRVLQVLDDLYFNSIKVQLKLRAETKQGRGSEFQFHKGTIKTRRATGR